MYRILVYGYRSILGSCILEAIQRSHCTYVINQDVIEDIDAIINCSNIKSSNVLEMLRVNALFPIELAQRTEVPIIHISTDKVFSGNSVYKYTTRDNPDPRDLYSRSKLLGEVRSDNVTNVRTSFIARGHGMSLGVEKGLKNVFWSGSTVESVARAIVRLARNPMPGIVHLATARSTSRYLTAKMLGFDPAPVYYPVGNFALVPSIVLPPLEEALKEWTLSFTSVPHSEELTKEIMVASEESLMPSENILEIA